jgi:hypothetical protein
LILHPWAIAPTGIRITLESFDRTAWTTFAETGSPAAALSDAIGFNSASVTSTPAGIEIEAGGEV